MTYKTPARERQRINAKRSAIKAAGGEAYAAMLARERAARALYRERHPEKVKAERLAWERVRQRKRNNTHRGNWTRHKFSERMRDARKRGIEATIRFDDIYWPTHCPVLGIALDYTTKRGSRQARNPANPSIDRWDNTKGYVPGNVYVISYRANVLKNDATADELIAIAKYATHGLSSSLPLFGALPPITVTEKTDA